MREKPKRSLLDRVPILGLARRVSLWLKAHKGWVYLGLAVLVIAVVRPFLTILAEIFKVFTPLVRTLLDNPVGRFIFYNVLAIVLLYWVWRQVRRGVYRVIGMYSMRRFIDGMNFMILGRWRSAITAFARVERVWSWIPLDEIVVEHRDIRRDARIKIATCYHRLGDANRALAWHKRVRPKDILSDHVRENHAELRALIYDISDELEQETILAELEGGRGKGAGNVRVLRALRERIESSGDLDRTRDIVRRLVAGTEGREKEGLQRDLARLEFRIAHQALGDGSSSSSKRSLKSALKIDAGDTKSALLLGDIALDEGDVKGALKAWSRAVGLPVFDRIAKLLDGGKLSGDKERKMLLDFFPYVGTMLVLAEHYRKRGDLRQAKAALDRVLEAAGESFVVAREYAACLEAEGDHAGAAELYRKAFAMSFG